MNNPTIRIGVLGELGVGKSELVNRICNPTTHINPSTMGPTIDVLDYKRPGKQENIWIEFLIIPSETRHPRSRQMLYSIGLDALFMVCNCNIPKTFFRAAEWLEEAKSAENMQDVDVALILGGPVPVEWTSNSNIVALVDPLANGYNAKVLDLSGYINTEQLDAKHKALLSGFYEQVIRRKQIDEEK